MVKELCSSSRLQDTIPSVPHLRSIETIEERRFNAFILREEAVMDIERSATIQVSMVIHRNMRYALQWYQPAGPSCWNSARDILQVASPRCKSIAELEHYEGF